MKKRIIGSLLLLIPMIILSIIYLCKSNDYELKYKIKGLNITEKYFDKLNMYHFSVDYNNNIYEMAVKSKYSKDQLINDAVVSSDNDITCIYLKSKKIKTYPVCIKDNNLVSYNLLTYEIDDFFNLDQLKGINKKYKDIKINTTLNENILIWNHFGYDLIKDSKQEKITIFNKETYADLYSFQIGSYVVVPDYDQKYEFNKFYIIDINSGNIDTINLDFNVSFNYYFLGTNEQKGYIFDKKNLKEYSIDPKKQTIELVSDATYGKVWDNKWEEISLVKLKNNEYKFREESIFNYVIENNKLYCMFYKSMNKILISEKVNNIIYSDNEKVYYTYNDKLYVSSPFIKEKDILEYDELNFNKGLTIYIY